MALDIQRAEVEAHGVTYINEPYKAIRKWCVECSGGNIYAARDCHIVDCPLWPYRIGQKPTTVAKKRPELLDMEKHLKAAKCEYRTR